MINVKKYFIEILIFILAGFPMENISSHPTDYETFADQVTNDFVKIAKKEFHLECMGTGGSMPNDIETFSISFIAYRKATIDQARKLEIQLIEKFIEIINSHKDIRPYLRDYPFPVHRACVSVSFYTKKNQFQNGNSICLINQARNKLFYSILESNTSPLKTTKEEPYLEAKELMEK